MYCKNCGKELAATAKFCDGCGAPTENNRPEWEKEPEENLPEGRPVTPNIYLCGDGKYRWIYEFNMVKNPTILFTVWRVLAMAAVIVCVIGFFITLPEKIEYGWSFDFEWESLKIPVIIVLVFIGISIIAYLIVAASYGWKYIVLFEMDTEQVVHIQLPKQYKKAQVLGILTTMVGAARGSLTTAGAGLLAASRNTSTSEFGNVTVIKPRKRSNTVFVNQRLFKNQIYAKDEDFEFVRDYIIARCPQAKVK